MTDRAATKAMEDLKFRAALVADGNAAIKDEFNEEISVRITFHEFSDKKLIFVLPTKAIDGEISDDVLGSVSGGRGDYVDSRSSRVSFGPVVCGYACYPTEKISTLALSNNTTVRFTG